jgi:hypothetical protein
MGAGHMMKFHKKIAEVVDFERCYSTYKQERRIRREGTAGLNFMLVDFATRF